MVVVGGLQPGVVVEGGGGDERDLVFVSTLS